VPLKNKSDKFPLWNRACRVEHREKRAKDDRGGSAKPNQPGSSDADGYPLLARSKWVTITGFFYDSRVATKEEVYLFRT
jgi:hypothetical protein